MTDAQSVPRGATGLGAPQSSKHPAGTASPSSGYPRARHGRRSIRSAGRTVRGRSDPARRCSAGLRRRRPPRSPARSDGTAARHRSRRAGRPSSGRRPMRGFGPRRPRRREDPGKPSSSLARRSSTCPAGERAAGHFSGAGADHRPGHRRGLERGVLDPRRSARVEPHPGVEPLRRQADPVDTSDREVHGLAEHVPEPPVRLGHALRDVADPERRRGPRGRSRSDEAQVRFRPRARARRRWGVPDDRAPAPGSGSWLRRSPRRRGRGCRRAAGGRRSHRCRTSGAVGTARRRRRRRPGARGAGHARAHAPIAVIVVGSREGRRA